MPLRTNTSFKQIADTIRAARSILVVSHYRPDGDAIGSSLAMALSLKKLGKIVHVLNEDAVPETLQFLPGSKIVSPPPADPLDVDLVLAVDCANRERLGTACIAAAAKASVWINIDHHKSNEGYGDQFYIDSSAPATGEILYELLEAAGLPIDDSVAANLYVAISTDTGSFQYQGTTARTYEIAGKLIGHGIDLADLNRKTYEDYPLRRVQLLRGLLNVMKITHDGRVASWALRQSLAAEVGIKPEDAEGLIDTLRSIRGVVAAAYFEELPDGKIRISLRSKNPSLDVGAIAAQFGGGGHTMAAGARLRGPIEEAEERIFSALHEGLKTT